MATEFSMSEKSDNLLQQMQQHNNNNINMLLQTKTEVNDDDEEDDIHIEGNSSDLLECFDAFDSVIEQVPFIDQICLLNDYHQNVSILLSPNISSPATTTTNITTASQSFSLDNYIIHEQIHPHFHLQTHDNVHHLSSTITTISSSATYFDMVKDHKNEGDGGINETGNNDARYFHKKKKKNSNNICVFCLMAAIYTHKLMCAPLLLLVQLILPLFPIFFFYCIQIDSHAK